MAKVKDFIRQEIVLCISFAAALLSCFFVPPDAEYAGYIDMRTLALLYCLMVVVAGIRKAGTFAWLSHALCSRAANTRALCLILTALCFISAMFITNDVALLTFVPFAVVVLGMAHQEQLLIRVVVLQTVAANLGSMLTPVGNPQNIYIQSYFGLSTAEFLQTTLPIWLASAVLIALLCLRVPSARLEMFLGEWPIIRPKMLTVYAVLFCVCLLTVLRIISWPVMLAIVAVVVSIYDRGMLRRADFMLLLTFVFFFIFSGNLARIDTINRLIRNILSGREYITGLVLSQVISNVPATLVLSGFAEDARALLLGVNVGGLGTPIASLASLISLKLYSHSENANTARFMLEFTVINLVLLAILSAAAALL